MESYGSLAVQITRTKSNRKQLKLVAVVLRLYISFHVKVQLWK